MALSADIFLGVLTFLVLTVSGIYGDGDFCWDTSPLSSTWCPYGCCGSRQNYCCSYVPNIALIIGLVIGGLLTLAVIITIVCCVCRRKGAPGQVLNPAPVGTTSTCIMQSGVTQTTAPAYTQPSCPYTPQTYPPGSFGYPVYTTTPYAAQTTNTSMAQPPAYPYGGVMSPPPYSEVPSHDNPVFKQ